MGFDPVTLANLRNDSLSLSGRFQKVIGTSNSTFFAASASTSQGSDPMSPGSFIALSGTNNKVFAVPGATIQAFGDGNQVIQQKVSTQQASSECVHRQRADCAAQQAFITQNPVRISQYIVGTTNAPAAASYPVTRPTNVGAYLASNVGSREAFVSRITPRSPSSSPPTWPARDAYVSARPAGCIAFLSATSSPRQSAFLLTNKTDLAAFVAGDKT